MELYFENFPEMLDKGLSAMHPDLEKLLNAQRSFVLEAIAKKGGFHPFACEMTSDGEVVNNHALVLDEADRSKIASSQKQIDMLTQVFRQKAAAGQLRAACIYNHVCITSPEKTNAICVSLEHENGEAINVYVPYKKSLLGKITYGEVFQTDRKREFFV